MIFFSKRLYSQILLQ